MSAENVVQHHQSLFGEKNKGKVRSVSEMMSFLPEINPDDRRYVEVYFRVQLLYVENKERKARRLSGLLTKFTGFGRFEDEHESLMAAIDFAVRGETRRLVKPSLNFNHSAKP